MSEKILSNIITILKSDVDLTDQYISRLLVVSKYLRTRIKREKKYEDT